MPKRTASDAGLEPGPSTPALTDNLKSTNAVDRQRLLNIISSCEEQSTRSESSDPSSLERSKNMFTLLRSYLDTAAPPRSYMSPYSDDEVEILQKTMITRLSRTWNDATHRRVATVTNKVARKRERDMCKRYSEAAKEEKRKRAKRWPENCYGCGCGSMRCSSCYEGFSE